MWIFISEVNGNQSNFLQVFKKMISNIILMYLYRSLNIIPPPRQSTVDFL